MYRHRSLFTKPQLKVEPPKKSFTSKVFGVLWKALKKTCMALGVFVLVYAVGATLFLSAYKSRTAVVPLPSDMVLYYRLDSGISEKLSRPTFRNPFPARSVTMPQLVRTLDLAERDDRVKGVVVSLHGAPLGVSKIQELRHSIKQIQEAGKFAYVIAPSYGASGGIGEYYLASVFDRIWMHPVGIVSAPGLSMETPYVGKVLDKLGVTPQFFQRKEFKSAFESFTSDKMSEASREANQAVVDALGDQIVGAIAQGRGLETAVVKEQIMKEAILPAPRAIEQKLVDALGYGDSVISYIEETYGLHDFEIVNVSKYAARVMRKKRSDTKVAYVHISGTLTLAPDPYGDYPDSALLQSGSEIAAAIQEAASYDNIEAIVLRVDSPGGTPAAAEVIRHAVVKAQENGKKVYVSMATVAASGGYWLSADADQIFALPGTLTGSIGVVGGKVTFQELVEKLDVTMESVNYGENADFWSATSPFSDAQIKSFEAMLDVTYENFITRVADGRGMSFEEAEERAKGRVWTGTQAVERDLVDGLGGLGTTLDVLAIDLGLEDQNDISLVSFPRPKARYQTLLEFIEKQAVLMNVMATFTPMFEHLSVMFDLPESGVNVHSGLGGV